MEPGGSLPHSPGGIGDRKRGISKLRSCEQSEEDVHGLDIEIGELMHSQERSGGRSLKGVKSHPEM
jgi:hypothetical protein